MSFSHWSSYDSDYSPFQPLSRQPATDRPRCRQKPCPNEPIRPETLLRPMQGLILALAAGLGLWATVLALMIWAFKAF
ncbi:hypothetical protein DFP90_10899 [Aestuariispira insulae]|uniref:Uncharacterized protein n=1 Tax=Aestuariispira insulae TaxID=1461337 RepID=A0A3D9HFQ5_9PROT|nr:hypothetical protein DFP90_10899 [Aestuariispira insulae]